MPKADAWEGAKGWEEENNRKKNTVLGRIEKSESTTSHGEIMLVDAPLQRETQSMWTFSIRRQNFRAVER